MGLSDFQIVLRVKLKLDNLITNLIGDLVLSQKERKRMTMQNAHFFLEDDCKQDEGKRHFAEGVKYS